MSGRIVAFLNRLVALPAVVGLTPRDTVTLEVLGRLTGRLRCNKLGEQGVQRRPVQPQLPDRSMLESQNLIE
ncbi:MAG TPA: hypothetical protein VFI95_11395 [Terriglobales bacterium]|nr:hypothetical protein [Terriglobales bacterium]